MYNKIGLSFSIFNNMDITANAKVSKAVAVHTEHTYAQSYNAGKLYITLCLSSSEKNIAALGKETLERLQREFFALDIKDLETIKKAVNSVISELSEDIRYEIILATTVENILYIITAGKSSGILLRNNASYVIAQGQDKQVLGFSGNLMSKDVIGLVTSDFLKIVPLTEFINVLSMKNDEMSENLAPHLIERATGGEAALIISLSKTAPEDVITSSEKTNKEEPIPVEAKGEIQDRLQFLKNIHIPKINISTLKNLSRKKMALIFAGLLIIILAGGIFIENIQRANSEREEKLQTILKSNTQAFEDATAILSLNRSLAVEELKAVRDEVEKELNNFPNGSSQHATLQEFLDKVNKIISGGGGTAASLNLFYEGNSSLKPEYVTYKGGALIASTTNTIQILKTDGKKDDDFKAPSAGPVSANENSVFLLSNSGIYKILKSNGKISEIIKDISGIKSFDIFGENVYILTNTILKFKANNYDEEKYLTDPVTFKNPTSMAIDSSIWVLDEGKIRKFTKGKEEGFSLREDLPLSSSAIIYTDEDYKNLYVLDPQKKFIAIVDKEGNLVKNLELTKAQKITSFTANEKDSKIYVTSDGNIYSIDF